MTPGGGQEENDGKEPTCDGGRGRWEQQNCDAGMEMRRKELGNRTRTP